MECIRNLLTVFILQKVLRVILIHYATSILFWGFKFFGFFQHFSNSVFVKPCIWRDEMLDAGLGWIAILLGIWSSKHAYTDFGSCGGKVTQSSTFGMLIHIIIFWGRVSNPFWSEQSLQYSLVWIVNEQLFSSKHQFERLISPFQEFHFTQHTFHLQWSTGTLGLTYWFLFSHHYVWLCSVERFEPILSCFFK